MGLDSGDRGELTDAVLARLAPRYGEGPMAAVSALLRHSGRVEFDPGELASVAKLPIQAVTELLEQLAEVGIVQAEDREICGHCDAALIADMPLCPNCDHPIDAPGAVAVRRVYVQRSERVRHVSWLLVVHGMNTQGPWQERLTWLVSNAYGFSVPVLIYKYGNIRPGVLLRWRQRQLLARLIARYHEATGEYTDARLDPRPDVIAHSFGTWLVAHGLALPNGLAARRVILTGSILRPDFDWAAIAEDRVEAVLNHRAGRDIPVRLSGAVIPDSGPSGIIGFQPDLRVIEYEDQALTHSGFFDIERLPAIFGQVWARFLREPDPAAVANAVPAGAWRARAPLGKGWVRWPLLGLLGWLAAAAALTIAGGVGEIALVPFWWVPLAVCGLVVATTLTFAARKPRPDDFRRPPQGS